MSATPSGGVELERPSQFGPYQLLRTIQSGGMGVVALAYDSSRKDIVVIKRLSQARRNEPEAVTRFRDEIGVAFRLKHRNLVSAVDWGNVDGEPYLSVEWVAGQDVRAAIQRAAHLGEFVPASVAASIVCGVCHALEYAHPRIGFVHRDVSPGNVMIGYDGVARLVDYGIALSEVKTHQTAIGVVAGTSGFLSPEQLQGRPADARSDLYSLGAVFWNLLTGAPLVGRGEDDASKQGLCERFARFRDDVPAELGLLLWKTLHKDPACRFASAADMRGAVEQIVRPAEPEEVAEYLSRLFGTEKRQLFGDLLEWQRDYDIRPRDSAEDLVVLPAAGVRLVRDGDAETKKHGNTAILEVVGRRSRVPLVIVAVVGVALVLSGVILALAKMGQGQQRGPAHVETAPATPVSTPQPTPGPVIPPQVKLTTTVAAPAPQKPVEPVKSKRGEPVRLHRVDVPAVPPSAPNVDEQLSRARSLVRGGQVALARGVLADLIREPVATERATVALADLEWHQGAYDEAIRLATKAIRHGAGVDALLLRASAELDSKHYSEAAEDFAHVLKLAPTNKDAFEGLTVAQQQMRRPVP